MEQVGIFLKIAYHVFFMNWIPYFLSSIYKKLPVSMQDKKIISHRFSNRPSKNFLPFFLKSQGKFFRVIYQRALLSRVTELNIQTE